MTLKGEGRLGGVPKRPRLQGGKRFSPRQSAMNDNSCQPVCACCDRSGYIIVLGENGVLEWRCDYHATDNYPLRVRSRFGLRNAARDPRTEGPW